MRRSIAVVTAPVRWFGLALVALAQYVFIVTAAHLSLLVFRVLNRTTVVRRQPTRLRSKTVILSNHQSLLDSFLVGTIVCFPQVLVQPWLLPWHLADGANFFSHPILRHLYRLLRAIPVGRSRNGARTDIDAFVAARRALRRGTLHVFPEGTRSTSQELKPFRRSVAGLILLTGATVLPVYFTGMHDVQPYRKRPGDGPPTLLRRLLGQRVEWLVHFRTGQQVHLTVGAAITPAELSRLAGDGSLQERSERLALVLQQKLEGLKSSTPSARGASAA